LTVGRLTNSLFASALTFCLGAAAFLCFVYPRFTYYGLTLSALIALLLVADAVLVLRDLWRPTTRARGIVAIWLYLPVLLLFGLMMQWEGPLYVAVEEGRGQTFQVRGLAGFCGLDVYSPEHNKAEWLGDDIGLVWSIEAHPQHWTTGSEFSYGSAPSGFKQTTPASGASPPPLDPDVTYALEVGRCMGGPEYYSLHGLSLAKSQSDPTVCWGDLKVAERRQPARVRVDCTTHQPFPMSERARERLKAYQQGKVVWY
jgi:hypothetical protein